MKSFLIGAVVFPIILYVVPAEAECNCVSIAADVSASVQAVAIKADGLYASGNYAAALDLYVNGYAASKEAVFLYAQAQCQWHLGRAAEAEALFRQYLAAGGSLRYKARAEAAVRSIAAGVTTAVGAATKLGADTAIGLTGTVGRVTRDTAGVGVGAVGGLDGTIRKKAKPPKIAKGAAILLGVVAVAAVGAFSIQGIQAGLSDDVEFDKRFGLSMGITGAVVGGTAVYLWGLTAVAPAATGVLQCERGAPAGKILAPVAYRGGGGIAAAFSF